MLEKSRKWLAVLTIFALLWSMLPAVWGGGYANAADQEAVIKGTAIAVEGLEIEAGGTEIDSEGLEIDSEGLEVETEGSEAKSEAAEDDAVSLKAEIKASNEEAACSYVTVDGVKDELWNSVPSLGTSETKGWENFHINHLKITNDCTYLYYFVEGLSLNNWGDNGLYLNLALSINNGAAGSEIAAAPWDAQAYNFSTAEVKPDFHIVSRIKGDSELNGAAVYAANDLQHPLAASWDDSKGAQFANSIHTGFEGRIPLSLLGLEEGDSVKAIAVLSGNDPPNHGVFDVIPETDGNQIADSWHEGEEPNTLADYTSQAHVISFKVPELIFKSSLPANNAYDVDVGLETIKLSFLGDLTWTEEGRRPEVSDGSSVIVADSSIDNDTINIELQQQLQYNTLYTVTVFAGSIIGLTEDKTISFTTERDPSTLNTYYIHYYRFDDKQNAWDIWTWDQTHSGKAVGFTSMDEDGFAVATITSFADSINVITRLGDWVLQESERLIQMPHGKRNIDVWLVEGDETVYYSKEDLDISDKIQAAFMDSFTTIEIETTKSVQDDQLDEFYIEELASQERIAAEVRKLGERSYRLTVNEGAIDVTKAYFVGHSSMNGAKLVMRSVLDERQFYYGGNDLGLTYSSSASTFKLWAPTAKTVHVAIYDEAGQYNEAGKVTDHSGGQETLLTRSSNGVWSGEIAGDLDGKYYMYRIEFADGTVNYVVDPYAYAVAANGARTAILDLADTDPADWEQDSKPPFLEATDAIIYELHVRDFSISETSGVSAQSKGKYAAFTETGLVDEHGNKLGIDHLAELGITHLHLLPVYDFQTVNELTVDDPTSSNVKYNWGYDPQNYNVPEGSYSTDAADPAARIIEFKEMVQALHNHGIRVVMDVVYNHTYSIEDGPFNKIVPGYYYRTNKNGTYSNGSGVGNEIATERPMVRKYIKDSVKYWAKEYHVDGFRFDLMGIIDTTTMKEITEELKSEIDPGFLIYGEPWMGGATPLPNSEQTLKGSQKDLNFAVFNDHFRSAIKGDSDGAGQGFATGNLDTLDGVVNGIRGAIDDFTNAPGESINYVTAHDNLNLWDKVLKTEGLFEELNMLNIKDGELIDGGDVAEAVANAKPYDKIDPNLVLENETVKRSLLANGIVLTAQGVPFIHAGDELLRSKYGDHNSYRSPDAVNQIIWSNKASFHEVNEYYKGLIKLRKQHPAFRMTTKQDINEHLQILRKEDGVVAFKLGEHANIDDWKNIIVIYNGNAASKTIELPGSGNWHVVVNDKLAGTDVLSTVSGEVTLAPISMMVLYDESKEVEAAPASLELKLPKVAIEPGQEIAAHAVVKDQQGRVMPGQAITWSSTNEQIARISSNGRITALSEGVTTITATAGALTQSLELHVAELVPHSMTLKGDSFVYVDFSLRLIPEVRDQFNQVMSSSMLDWSSSNPTIAAVNSSGLVTGISAGHVTITASIGEVTASFELEVKSYVKRYIQFEYSRTDYNYTDWDMWLWNTGVRDGAFEFTVKDNKAIALVEIGPNVTNVGFIVRRGGDAWSEKDADADRFVNVALDENFVVVKLASGQASFTQTKRITGPVIDDNDVTFYYRNDELYRANEHDRITDVKVSVSGEVYTLAYNEEEQYYYYTLEDIEEGEYIYQFIITLDGEQQTINDPKNTIGGISKIVYRPVRIEAEAFVSPDKLNYNTHSILTIETESSIEDISRIYADLTALGGRAEVDIDKELKALTLSVTDQITAGKKTIPVTIVDVNQVKHHVQTEVTVEPRRMKDSKDFDWDEARIYFMLTDRFSDGDESNNDPNGEGYEVSHPQTYHGGDFQGIIDRLDYLEQLGINTIWITPIIDNIDWNVGQGQLWEYQYGYHGYWAKDFTKLDEHLGDLETFKELIDKAHDRGIKIMVDVVLNHAGYGMNAATAPADIRNFPTEEERAVFEGMLRQTPINGDDILGELAGLPDLMTELPEVREQIVQWQVDWLERARTDRGDTIDFFRVDTVKHVENTTWLHFKNELTKVQPDFKLIGEVFNAYVDDQRGYLGSGMMDALLDFRFNDLAKSFIDGKIDAVEQELSARNNQLTSAATLGQFLSSHDEDGFLAAYANGDLGKQKIAAALQITAKGQPVIYYGEELGMSGTHDRLGEGDLGSNRYDMPWDELEERSDMLTHYQKLLQARAQYSKVFAKGSRAKLAGGDEQQYLVFERAYDRNSVYVGINTSDTVKPVSFAVDASPGKMLKDLYSGKFVKVSGDRTVTIELPARSEGGTILLANPYSPPVVTPSPTPSEETGDDQRTIIVGDSHLSSGAYRVTLDALDAVVTLNPSALNEPVVITAGNTSLTITEAQLAGWADQYSSIELRLSEGTAEQAKQIAEQAADKGAEVILHSSIINLQLWAQSAGGNELSPLNDGVELAWSELKEKLGIDEAEDFDSLNNLGRLRSGGSMPYVYEVLPDGTLKYVPVKLVDGKYTLLTNGAGSYVVASYNKHFSDVAEGHWAAELIVQAAAKQLIEGRSKDAFDPSGEITRAEFTAILARVLQLTSDASVPFHDIAEDKWYAKAIAGAYEAGLIQGASEQSFAPNAFITREQMAVLIVRAIEYKQGKQLAVAAADYADASDIAAWALEAIGKATAAGILEGKADNKFDPKGKLTRAEAVKVLLALEEL